MRSSSIADGRPSGWTSAPSTRAASACGTACGSVCAPRPPSSTTALATPTTSPSSTMIPAPPSSVLTTTRRSSMPASLARGFVRAVAVSGLQAADHKLDGVLEHRIAGRTAADDRGVKDPADEQLGDDAPVGVGAELVTGFRALVHRPALVEAEVGEVAQ